VQFAGGEGVAGAGISRGWQRRCRAGLRPTPAARASSIAGESGINDRQDGLPSLDFGAGFEGDAPELAG